MTEHSFTGADILLPKKDFEKWAVIACDQFTSEQDYWDETDRKKHAGRNNYGRITVRHHGGGNKVKYRLIDFKRSTEGVAKVIGVEYDPNRTAYIALVEYENGTRSYILAPAGLTDGATVESSATADIIPGNTLPVANIPVGTLINNIELYPGKGGQLVRSAGTAAQLMAKENGSAQIRLPSG